MDRETLFAICFWRERHLFSCSFAKSFYVCTSDYFYYLLFWFLFLTFVPIFFSLDLNSPFTFQPNEVCNRAVIRSSEPTEGLKIQGGIVFWNRVLRRHFLGIKMEHWNNFVWAHFYKIFEIFEVPYWPESKGKGKELKLAKVCKGCLKPIFFLWFSHWWNRFCDWLGVAKDIKDLIKFYWKVMTSDLISNKKRFFDGTCSDSNLSHIEEGPGEGGQMPLWFYRLSHLSRSIGFITNFPNPACTKFRLLFPASSTL